MIRTKQAIDYQDRGVKSSFVEIEIHSYATTKEGIELLVHDWVWVDGVKTIYKAENHFFSNMEVDALDAYLFANEQFIEETKNMSKTQRDWHKLKIALMFDTQVNVYLNGQTIYKLMPSDWEFSE